MSMKPENTPAKAVNFIRQVIEDDLQAERVKKVVTRFPPEPNGYLHIGHAKSISVNFGLAEEFDGECNLRFDDTNPAKEEQEYVDAIIEDLRWLGYQWAGDIKYASDYFDQFYQWAVELVKNDKAYVCDLDAEQASEYRGWANTPGKPSPYRDRNVEDNLQLLEKMRIGEFDEGHCTLRAKIDMSSPNMNMRDPILYRIRKASHHQTGDKWCIYPSYDFAHGQGDAIEGVSHSICTLEFQDHRPLYDWFISNLSVPFTPHQYEFGRLNLNYTVTSKRKLKRLVDENIVDGWDDPRMPTISGMRRRGFTAAGIRSFCQALPVAKSDGVVDIAQLESAIRDDLNQNAPRAMCVINPLKVTLLNIGDDELLQLPNHPNKPDMGSREVPFTREIFIDRSDFTTEQGLSRKKFKRLVLGEYVRLRGAYVIKAEDIVTDDQGEVIEISASIVPGTIGENPPAEMKPRGVIHWVSASKGKKAKVRVYDRLFSNEAPDRDDDFMHHLNPESLRLIETAVVEPYMASVENEQVFQFEREGYFVADRYDYNSENLVFNKTIGLVDHWSNKN